MLHQHAWLFHDDTALDFVLSGARTSSADALEMVCAAKGQQLCHCSGGRRQGMEIGYKRAERQGRAYSEYGDDPAEPDYGQGATG